MNNESVTWDAVERLRIDPVLWCKMWWLALQNMLARGQTAINCCHPRPPDHNYHMSSHSYIFSRQLHVVFFSSQRVKRPHLSLICLFLLTTTPLSFLFTFFCLPLFYFIRKRVHVKCKAVEEETHCSLSYVRYKKDECQTLLVLGSNLSLWENR